MTISGLKKPPILATMLLGAIAIGVAMASVLVGRHLYTVANKSTEFYAKLGELALQLAVLVIVGALVKAAIDWGTSQRTRYLEKLEARKEFMRRVRAMHIAIQDAKDLMNAHQSAKTWGEQSRRLMGQRTEVEEISEDLKASDGLFAKQTEIIEGLEGIISYLTRARDEYVRSRDPVDNGHKAGRSLSETIDQGRMTWLRDFIAGGESYRNDYEANLTKSKGAMRAEVYGA
jgi:hypothetical protein